MFRIRRWFGKKRQVVWTEPELPRFVKTNPMASGVPTDAIQPGDMTMGIMAREFLESPESPDEDPE